MAARGTRLVVDRNDLAESALESATVETPTDGVVLAVERFAVTTNNVSYAVTGDQLGYWRFFPTDDETTGVVPAWGVATVVASDRGDVVTGERWYGLLPMATHVAIRPGRVATDEVIDASPHREELAGVYQRYSRLEADPLHDEDTLDLELLLRPLFTTAFLLAEVVDGDAGERHDAVVVTSASSKTGTALGHLVADRDVAGVAITSEPHVQHVVDGGVFDRVLAYDGLEGLADVTGRVALVDLAGRPDVVAGIHEALPDGLTTHLVVGATHRDAAQTQVPPVEGAPDPTFFFAPTHAAELARAWGPSVLADRIADAWRPFVASAAETLDVVEVDGLTAAAAQWRRLVAGRVDPGVGLVVDVG